MPHLTSIRKAMQSGRHHEPNHGEGFLAACSICQWTGLFRDTEAEAEADRQLHISSS